MPGNIVNKITPSNKIGINAKLQVEICHHLGDAAAVILECVPQVFFTRPMDDIQSSYACETEVMQEELPLAGNSVRSA